VICACKCAGHGVGCAVAGDAARHAAVASADGTMTGGNSNFILLSTFDKRLAGHIIRGCSLARRCLLEGVFRGHTNQGVSGFLNRLC
jgi:hypothetical protein